jgi:integrase
MGRRPSLQHQIYHAIDATFVNNAEKTSRGRARVDVMYPDHVAGERTISRHLLKHLGVAEEYTVSYGTARTYRQSSCSFFNRLPQDMALRWLRHWTPDLTIFGVDLMRSEGLSDSYIEKTLSGLRKLVEGMRLLGWTRHDRITLVPDTLYVDLQRSPPRLGYRATDAAAIATIIAADPHDGADFARIIRLIRAGGTRRVEWSYLREDDLDRGRGLIKVRHTTAKGGKERLIMLDDPGRAALRVVLQDLPRGQNWLFPETRQLAKRLEEAIRAACNELGVRCLGQHGYRALFAEEFLRRRMVAGLTEREARQELTVLLGHRRVDVTYRYVPALS